MRFWLYPLLNELRYSKAELIKDLQGKNLHQTEISAIQHSIIPSFAVFALPGKFYEVSQFGYKLHCNYLMHGIQLDDASLRRLFTGIELLVFKLICLRTEVGKRYDLESESATVRFGKLVKAGVLPKSLKDAFDNITWTRHAFAHSFLEAHELPFRNVPLEDCFGTTFLGGQHLDETMFASDQQIGVFIFEVQHLTDTLIECFRPVQFKQIDIDKLFSICDRLLRPRKLLP